MTETTSSAAGLPQLESIQVGADGSSTWRPRNTPLALRFRYRNSAFSATAIPGVDPTSLSLRADLGKLPYSIEAPGVRCNLLAAVSALASSKIGRLTLDDGHRLEINGEIPIAAILTPMTLMAAVAEFVLRIRPWLDPCLDQVAAGAGIAAPVSAAPLPAAL